MPGELIADREQNYDVNARLTAGLKISTNLTGVSFESNNGIVRLEEKPGEYLLYLSPNERLVTIRKYGYAPFRIILNEYGINLSSGEVWQVEVTGDNVNSFLQGQGNYILHTVPEGVNISIGGLPDFSAQTPYEFTEYAAQGFQLTLTKDHYESLSYQMDIADGITKVDTVELTPKFGYVQPLIVDEDGDTIEHGIANISGSISDSSISLKHHQTVNSGTQSVQISAEGYSSTKDSIVVQAGERKKVTYTLEKQFGYAGFDVFNTERKPIEANIALEDTAIVEAENNRENYYALHEGFQIARFTADGYVTKNVEINVRKDSSLQKEVILLRPEQKNLFPVDVVVYSDEEAEIQINQNRSNGNVYRGSLLPGVHDVTIKHPYETVQQKISVNADDGQRIYVPVLPSKSRAYKMSFIPGGGHIYTHRNRGWIYLGATVIGGMLSYTSYREFLKLENRAVKLQNEYSNATTQSEVLALSDQLNEVATKRDKKYDNFTLSGLTTLGLYLLSHIDIRITKPKHGYRVKVTFLGNL